MRTGLRDETYTPWVSRLDGLDGLGTGKAFGTGLDFVSDLRLHFLCLLTTMRNPSVDDVLVEFLRIGGESSAVYLLAKGAREPCDNPDWGVEMAVRWRFVEWCVVWREV